MTSETSETKLMVIHVLCIFLKQFKLIFLIVETTADYSEWLVKERC